MNSMPNIDTFVDTIITGDNCSVLWKFPDACIDLVVTSPPYDNLRVYGGHTWDFEGVARELTRVLKPGGVIVWVVADATVNGSETLTSMRQAIFFHDQCGLNVHDTMIYQAAGTGAKGSCYSYWQGFEYMFILSKGQPKSVNRLADIKNTSIGLVRQGRYRDGGNKEREHKTNEFGIRTNVWTYNVGFMSGSAPSGHPAVFPDKLAADHIHSWSNPGDIVLDPFSGSGTTCVAAKALNRHWIGIEINEEYNKMARRRIESTEMPLL